MTEMAQQINQDKKYTLPKFLSTAISAVIGSVITGAITFFGFYYNTNNTLDNHTIQIKALDDKVGTIDNKLNSIVIKPAQIEEKINSMDKKVTDISHKQDKMDERIDRIYEILVSKNK